MKNLKTKLSYAIYFVLVAFVVGCGKVNDYEWKEACEVCKEHKGVRYVNLDITAVRVRCNDGFYQQLNGN